MDFFENQLKINQIIIIEFLNILSSIEKDIQFYKDYPFEKSNIKIQKLEYKKKEILDIIHLFHETGRLHK
jgi:hypothetical protein